MLFDQIFKFYNAATRVLTLFGGLVVPGNLSVTGVITATGGAIAQAIQALIYGPAIVWNAALGEIATVAITDNVAFAIGAPSNLRTGVLYSITLSNVSGGAHGAGTWNAIFKTTGNVPAIADTKNRTFTFYYNGTNLIQVNEPASDVAN